MTHEGEPPQDGESVKKEGLPESEYPQYIRNFLERLPEQRRRDVNWCLNDLQKRKPDLFSKKPVNPTPDYKPAPGNIPLMEKDPNLN